MRASGRTTRLIDQAIQTLFEKGEVTIVDHHPTMQAAKRMTDFFYRRMQMEHPHVKIRVSAHRDYYYVKIIKDGSKV